jgi:hypothetical protein
MMRGTSGVNGGEDGVKGREVVEVTVVDDEQK